MPMSLSAVLIASPMPRVPPVTIATRAMKSSSMPKPTRLGRRSPTFKFAGDQPFEHRHPFGRIVEAVEPREMRAAGGEERLAPADAKLFDGFETVCGKTGRSDGDPFDALAGISAKRRLGCRLEPFGAAETRLEGDVKITPQRFAEQARGLPAMAVIGIAQFKRAL